MRDHVILRYQTNGTFPIWDFCYSAVFGAEQNGTKHRPFESIDQIDSSPYNVIVGSVEECSRWLSKNGYNVPQEIDITPSVKRKESPVREFLNENSIYPVFIKPSGTIKAFTGTVVTSKEDAEMVLSGYEGNIWIYKHVMDFISEWRAYIHNGKLVKICHYKGEPLEFPDHVTVRSYLKMHKDIPYKAFTLDFGVAIAPNGSTNTYLIEGNDMWAIANYGLEPDQYYQAIKDRWLQITGVIQ
jgi:hypothetical protein